MNNTSLIDLPETAFEFISQNLDDIRDVLNLEVYIIILIKFHFKNNF